MFTHEPQPLEMCHHMLPKINPKSSHSIAKHHLPIRKKTPTLTQNISYTYLGIYLVPSLKWKLHKEITTMKPNNMLIIICLLGQPQTKNQNPKHNKRIHLLCGPLLKTQYQKTWQNNQQTNHINMQHTLKYIKHSHTSLPQRHWYKYNLPPPTLHKLHWPITITSPKQSWATRYHIPRSHQTLIC